MGMMSLFCLMFLIALMATLLKTGSTTSEKTSEAFSHLFVLGMFYFPLAYGIKLYRQGKNERSAASLSVTAYHHRISVTVRIKRSEYIQLVYALTYRHPVMQYFTFLGISMLLLQLIHNRLEFLPFQTSIGALALLAPLTIYFQARRNYSSNAYVKEAVAYEFTADQVIAQGETFRHTIQWSSLHQVKELKHWFLLYNTTQTLLAIPKRSFESAQDIIDFKNQILTTKDLRKELLPV
jgi:hypothetical protein